jgi:TP53 regulating kinase and related kinases
MYMIKKIIQQGAEAILTKENSTVIKDRIKKSYRINVIDEKLRKSRTKSEAKIINKLQNTIPVPKIISTDDKQKITMEYIEGEKLSENLEKLDYKNICKIISENISKMHDNGIIHGDLTTSNMIYKKDENKVYFIDFGLAFQSTKIEDKAVDLHLLQQALEAKHFTIEKQAIKIILDNYNSKDKTKVLKRIKDIESRGRYKDKY